MFSRLGRPPCEVMTLLTPEGGLGWKCVSVAPCCVWQGTLLSEVLLWRRQLLFPLSEVYLRASLSSGLTPLSCWPTQTDAEPLGFLVGSCKPPACTGLYSYGEPALMVVQVPYTCKYAHTDPCRGSFDKCLTMSPLPVHQTITRQQWSLRVAEQLPWTV